MNKKVIALMGALIFFGAQASATDFISLDAQTYQQARQYGKTLPMRDGIENPDQYGIPFDGSSATYFLTLATPYTISVYLSYSEGPRLLQIPDTIASDILQNQNILYIVTGAANTKNIFSVPGRVKNLVLVKNGKRIYPQYTLPAEIEKLMPSSKCASYFGFTREQILDAPYTIKYVSGEGDLKSFDITPEQIEHMIKDEKNFKA